MEDYEHRMVFDMGATLTGDIIVVDVGRRMATERASTGGLVLLNNSIGSTLAARCHLGQTNLPGAHSGYRLQGAGCRPGVSPRADFRSPHEMT